MKKISIIIIAFLLLGSMLIAQPAQGKHSYVPAHANDWDKTNLKPRLMANDPMMDCMAELKLSDAQMKKMGEIRAAFQKTQNTVQAELENLQIDLKTAIKNEDYKQAKALNKQIATKENAMADARIDFMADRMKELTPEQKEIMKKNMQQMMGKGMQNMPGECQGMMQGMHQSKENCTDCGDCPEPGKGEGPMHKSKIENPK